MHHLLSTGPAGMSCAKHPVLGPAELSPGVGRAKGHQWLLVMGRNTGWAAAQQLGLLFLGWSSQCLQDWGPFFALAIPSMLMMCIEWWAYEIGSILMGMWKSRAGKQCWWLTQPRNSSPNG